MFVDDDGDADGLFRVSVRAHTARLLGATPCGRYWRGVVVFLIIRDIKPFVGDPRRRCRRVTRRIRRRSHLCRRLTPSARISAPPAAASLFTTISSQPAATQSTINDQLLLFWGPIYKISYDNLTIILR